ncbi:hypothetical protein [Loktanella sp. Alg231-35]|uniref:hypothetical protein n=1 Tax=Loktanella sp. Alg231-35 TaxID=1922220 RepID=UPI000D558F41|nr:hypothetical protein [Loktanella sp. Alg231-35]
MNRSVALTVPALVLAACSDQRADDSTDPDPDTGGVTDPTPGAVTSDNIVVGDLRAATYNAGDGSLLVQITLDGNDVNQSYGPATADGDYDIFTLQNSATDRFFTAFAGESTDGSVSAVVVSDGGQFNRFFGGATVNQVTYAAPTGGIANYSGDYVGLLNFGPAAGDGPGEASTPQQSMQVNGEVFFKADFTDNAVNGNIYNRTYGPTGTGTALPEIVLTVGDISADGSFTGTVELRDLTGIGDYSGAFGGSGATAVAGTVALGAGFSDGAIAGADGREREYGIFVLDQDAP